MIHYCLNYTEHSLVHGISIIQGKGLMATFLYAPTDEDLKLRPDDIASMGLQQGGEEEADVDVFPGSEHHKTSLLLEMETDGLTTAAATTTHDHMGQDLMEVDPSSTRWSHRSSTGQNAHRSSVGQQQVRGEINSSAKSILDVLGRDSVASVQSDAMADALMDAFCSRGSECAGMGQDGVRTPGRPRVTGGISSSTAPPGSTGRGLTRVGNTSLILKGNAFAEVTSSLMDQQQQVSNHNGLPIPSITASKAMNKLALLKMGSTRNRSQQAEQQQQRLQSRQGSSSLSSPEPGQGKASFPRKSHEFDKGLDLPINISSEANLSASRPPEFTEVRRTTSLRVNSQEDGSEGASPVGSSSTTHGMTPLQGTATHSARKPIVRRDSNVNVIHTMMKLMSQTGGIQEDYDI